MKLLNNITQKTKFKKYVVFWLENIAKSNYSVITYQKNLSIINSKLLHSMR